MTASPFQGVATEQKAKNRKIHSHSHSLITTAQALLGTPGEVQPDMFLCSAKNNISVIIWGLVTPRTPDKTPLLPAESHRRCPIPLHTASKVWLCLHFINHTILSVTLLHTSRPMQNPLASSKPISLSAHALLTPSLHLKGDLPLPLCLPLLTYTLF